MSTVLSNTAPVQPAVPPRSFVEWRSRLSSQGVPAVIGIAGSRGKTTIVRLLNAIFQQAGLRTALWTDQGIEVNGRRQRGELVPWSRAIERLAGSDLDVAIQELDWSLVHAVGLPPQTYPIVAISNLCVNNDSCLVRTESVMAGRALPKLRAAARHDGVLVLSGEDFSVGEHPDQTEAATVLVGLSRDTPLVRNHLRAGGSAVWTEDRRILAGTIDTAKQLGATSNLAFALDGAIGFQVHNALMASAVALACGIPEKTIAAALSSFIVPATAMPGSFNVLAIDDAVVVVDRPAPSWFLRTALRGIIQLLSGHRLITVAGKMDNVPEADLVETGRLLGRAAGVLILHGTADQPERVALLRQGVAANKVPPLVVHVATERQAIARALSMLRPDDLAFILADQPASVLRALNRARQRAVAAG